MLISHEINCIKIIFLTDKYHLKVLNPTLNLSMNICNKDYISNIQVKCLFDQVKSCLQTARKLLLFSRVFFLSFFLFLLKLVFLFVFLFGIV
jgi:hypothetical protein